MWRSIDRPPRSDFACSKIGGEFADGVIQSDANRAHCRYVVTFDQNFARLAGPGRCVLLGAEPGR